MDQPHVPLDTVRASHDRLLGLAAGLTDESAAAPSALPDWTRAHVAAHVVNNARAFTRMTREALAGRLVPMYDGGAEGRNADIEEGAALPAAQLVEDLRASARELEEAWAKVGPDDWDRPITFRDATLAETVFARWRESEIHAVDLDLGVDCTSWSPDFCGHAIAFLLVRLPVESGASLVPDDDARQWVVGAGDGPRVSAPLCCLTAWIAGRAPVHDVRVEGGDLPVLAPWPAPVPRAS
jgi:maleylpyruvate isomerase